MEREGEDTRSYKTEIVTSNLIFLNKKSDFDEIDSSTSSTEDVISDDDMF